MGIVRNVLLVSYGVVKKIDGTNLFQGCGKYWINPENGYRSRTLILRHFMTVQSRQVQFEGETHVKKVFEPCTIFQGPSRSPLIATGRRRQFDKHKKHPSQGCTFFKAQV